MYFCPCSCTDPLDSDPPEDNALFSLPRNLSYVQDSYLDRYSVSSRYVHNTKTERRLHYEQGQEWKANVEEETLGLLSAITAQDLHGRCDGAEFNALITTSGFVFPSPETVSRSECSPSSTSGTTTSWSAGRPGFSASTLLHPASLVASRISSFLHSPPNESMDSARDFGTSVDGENLSAHLETINSVMIDSPIVSRESTMASDSNAEAHNPDHSGDAGVEIYNTIAAEGEICFVGEDVLLVDDEEHLFAQNADVSKEEGSLVEFSVIATPTRLEQDIQADSVMNPSIYSTLESLDIKSPFCREVITHYTPLEDSNSEKGNVRISGCNDPRQPRHLSALRDFDVENRQIESRALNIQKDDSGRVVTSTGSSMSFGSPDSDAFSEEGVFFNIDDLDSTNDKSTTVSDTSEDTCVSADSMFLSPEEADLEEDAVHEPARKMTLEEAINRAASDLNKMNLDFFEADLPSAPTSHAGSSFSLLDVEEDLRFSSLGMRTAGRSSPVRITTSLKIKITDQSGLEPCTLLTDSSSTLSESPIYTEQEFNFSRVQLRKSSSLKSNKTPPGTPHRKKVVRFADAMGLDLESVRHVLNMESPPRIPPSALADLKDGLHEDSKELGSKYLCACFNQPAASDTFFAKVLTQKVSLENAIINGLTITGFVRVANISYHKVVRIRYTHNSWSSFYDIAASYVLNSCDGPTDRFSFSIVAPPYFGPGSRLEFAVNFIADGVEYWDSNEGKNYVFECFARSMPSDSDTSWMHFL